MQFVIIMIIIVIILFISINPPVKSKEEKVLDRERVSGRDWIFLSL